jgi:hypothetical protein
MPMVSADWPKDNDTCRNGIDYYVVHIDKCDDCVSAHKKPADCPDRCMTCGHCHHAHDKA